MADTRNVIVGAAAFYISRSTSVDSPATAWTAQLGLTAVPTKATLTDTSGTAAWRDVGFTQEGVEVAYEPDFGEVEVDQLMDSAKLFKQGMRVTVNTTLAEATLENLLVVWGAQPASRTTTGSGATLVETLDIQAGALGDDPVERGLVFVGPAPRNTTDNSRRERVYHVKRAIQTESSSHALRKAEGTVFPVSFRALPDTSQSVALYGRITDRQYT